MIAVKFSMHTKKLSMFAGISKRICALSFVDEHTVRMRKQHIVFRREVKTSTNRSCLQMITHKIDHT